VKRYITASDTFFLSYPDPPPSDLLAVSAAILAAGNLLACAVREKPPAHCLVQPAGAVWKRAAAYIEAVIGRLLMNRDEVSSRSLPGFRETSGAMLKSVEPSFRDPVALAAHCEGSRILTKLIEALGSPPYSQRCPPPTTPVPCRNRRTGSPSGATGHIRSPDSLVEIR